MSRVPAPARPHARLREWAQARAIAGVRWLVLRTFVLQALRVSSESMEGTLFAGDVLFAAHPLYGADVPLVGVRLPPIREPRHGDLVVFESRFPAAPTPDAPSPAPNRDGP